MKEWHEKLSLESPERQAMPKKSVLVNIPGTERARAHSCGAWRRGRPGLWPGLLAGQEAATSLRFKGYLRNTSHYSRKLAKLRLAKARLLESPQTHAREDQDPGQQSGGFPPGALDLRSMPHQKSNLWKWLGRPSRRYLTTT